MSHESHHDSFLLTSTTGLQKRKGAERHSSTARFADRNTVSNLSSPVSLTEKRCLTITRRKRQRSHLLRHKSNGRRRSQWYLHRHPIVIPLANPHLPKVLTNLTSWYCMILRPVRARILDETIQAKIAQQKWDLAQARREALRREADARRWPAAGPIFPNKLSVLVEAAQEQPPKPPARAGSETLSTLTQVFMQTSMADLLWMWFLIVLVMTGYSLQILMLNFWLASFERDSGPGNYTTLVVSSSMFSFFFMVTLGVYVLVERPSLKFVWTKRGWWLLLWVGTSDTITSVLTIYAASHTSEVLQALCSSMVPLVAALLQKIVLNDPRNYCNQQVVVAFVCIASGVLAASGYSFIHAAVDQSGGEGSSRDRFIWSLLFLLSVVPSVVQGVRGAEYMIDFTKDPLFEEWFIQKRCAEAQRSRELADPLPFPEGDEEEVLSNRPAAGRDEFEMALLARRRPAHSQRQARPRPRAGDDVAVSDEDSTAPRCPMPTLRRRYGTFCRIICMRDTEEWEGVKDDDEMDVGHVSLLPSEGSRTDISGGAFRGECQVRFTNLEISPSQHSSSGGSDGVLFPQRGHGSFDYMYTEHRDEQDVYVAYSVAQGDDLAVKLVLLATETTIQAVQAILLLPMDTLPWWGGSRSLPEAWASLQRGVGCLFLCPNNLLFCLLYCFGFVLTYLGTAYLNHSSVTLCSMVCQLAAPVTALLLIAYPQLNLAGDSTPWYFSALAIVLLAMGTVLYTLWDQQTMSQKTAGENQVKEAYVQPHVVVVNEAMATP